VGTIERMVAAAALVFVTSACQAQSYAYETYREPSVRTVQWLDDGYDYDFDSRPRYRYRTNPDYGYRNTYGHRTYGPYGYDRPRGYEYSRPYGYRDYLRDQKDAIKEQRQAEKELYKKQLRAWNRANGYR
jgi:hypothetical protein